MKIGPKRRAKALCCATSISWSRKNTTQCSFSASRISPTVPSSSSRPTSTPKISAPPAPEIGRTSIRLFLMAHSLRIGITGVYTPAARGGPELGAAFSLWALARPRRPHFTGKKSKSLPKIALAAQLCFILPMVFLIALILAWSRPLHDVASKNGGVEKNGENGENRTLALELRAIPVRPRRRGRVGAIAEVEQRPARRGGASHIVVLQPELAGRAVVERGVGPDRRRAELGRLGGGIGIEGRIGRGRIARPPADAADLVRVAFAGDRVGLRHRRRAPAGEAGDAEIEAAPEEMHRARLADEAAAELLQHRIDRAQHAPEALDRIAFVGGVRGVLVERDRIVEFLRRRPG